MPNTFDGVMDRQILEYDAKARAAMNPKWIDGPHEVPLPHISDLGTAHGFAAMMLAREIHEFGYLAQDEQGGISVRDDHGWRWLAASREEYQELCEAVDRDAWVRGRRGWIEAEA